MTIHSIEAEGAVIAAVIAGAAEYQLIDVVPGDFFIERHGMIWEAFGELHKAGVEIDTITIADRLEGRGELKSIGGLAYLIRLLAGTPSTAHFAEYAEIVKAKAARRQLAELGERMVKAAYDEQANVQELQPGFMRELTDSTMVAEGAVPLSVALSELYDEIVDRMANPVEIWGIPTGIPKYDEIAGGLQLSEIMIMSGRPGVGKSILANQIAINMASHEPGAIYSMEMRSKQSSRRMVSSESKIVTSALKKGNIDDWQWGQVLKAIQRLEKLPVHLSDGSYWTTAGLRADLARLQARHGIKWFILDYLYLLKDRGSNETEKTMIISSALKGICQELNIAGLAVHSMTKGGMAADVPDMSELRGSGQVSFDADVITFLTPYRPMSADERKVKKGNQVNMRTLWIDKGREIEDPRRYIQMIKHVGYPAFTEAKV